MTTVLNTRQHLYDDDDDDDWLIDILCSVTCFLFISSIKALILKVLKCFYNWIFGNTQTLVGALIPVEVKSLSETLFVLRRSECAEGPLVYRKLLFVSPDTAWAAPYLGRIYWSTTCSLLFLISDLLNLNRIEIHLSGTELLSTDLITLMFPMPLCHGVKGCQMGLAHIRDMIRVSI